MSIEAATVWGPVIAAALAAIISLIVSYITQRSTEKTVRETAKSTENTAQETARAEVEQKLNELKQIQITDVIHQRIIRYPSLWKLCQQSISMQILKVDELQSGWEVRLFGKLEEWHAANGVFVSQPCYDGLFRLRLETWGMTRGESRQGEAARKALKRLDEIWSEGFVDSKGISHPGLAFVMKDDLGSYEQAALSSQFIPTAGESTGHEPNRVSASDEARRLALARPDSTPLSLRGAQARIPESIHDQDGGRIARELARYSTNYRRIFEALDSNDTPLIPEVPMILTGIETVDTEDPMS